MFYRMVLKGNLEMDEAKKQFVWIDLLFILSPHVFTAFRLKKESIAGKCQYMNLPGILIEYLDGYAFFWKEKATHAVLLK